MPLTSHSLHGQNLETTSSVKYLGITINKHLTRPFHSRQRQQSSWLLAAKLADLSTKPSPYLPYASTVRGTHSQRDIALAALKKTATQAALSYLTDPKWENLEQQKLCNQLTMLYTINSNTADINRQQFHKQGDPRTTGAQKL